MKIIEHGNIDPVYRVICHFCNCEFEFTRSEATFYKLQTMRSEIKCPECETVNHFDEKIRKI